jgi:hypothetical protein
VNYNAKYVVRLTEERDDLQGVVRRGKAAAACQLAVDTPLAAYVRIGRAFETASTCGPRIFRLPHVAEPLYSSRFLGIAM